MSEQTSKDEFCVNCKVNLTQGQTHTEICKFLQKSEAEKQKIKEDADKAIQKAKDELEAKAKDEKEQLTKEVRQKLLDEIQEEKEKKLQLLKEKDEQIKKKFIKKIVEFLPENYDLEVEKLQDQTLDNVMKFYRKIIKIQVAELKKKFTINCSKCKENLGKTVTMDEAEKILKAHKKICPKNSNLGKWLLVGLVVSMIAGSVAFVKSNPHILKKGKKDDGTG